MHHLTHIPFTSEETWQKEAALCIHQAFVDYGEASYAFEFLVRERLAHKWYLMIQHNKVTLCKPAQEDRLELQRLKYLIAYIHHHSNESIQMQDIACSVSVSERECLRSFRKIVSDTPIRYLSKYRISKAIEHLERNDYTITEIGEYCGFDNPSYFAKVFKQYVQMSPREYRKKYTNL